MAYCIECSSALPDGAKFCGNCGTATGAANGSAAGGAGQCADKFGVAYSADRKRLLRAPVGLESYVVWEWVTSIADGAFENCSALQSITISGSVTSIGSFAFLGCSSLASITIPTTVVTLGEYVFKDCTSLRSISVCTGSSYFDSLSKEYPDKVRSLTEATPEDGEWMWSFPSMRIPHLNHCANGE